MTTPHNYKFSSIINSNSKPSKESPLIYYKGFEITFTLPLTIFQSYLLYRKSGRYSANISSDDRNTALPCWRLSGSRFDGPSLLPP